MRETHPMTASEALRRARVFADCGYASAPTSECWQTQSGDGEYDNGGPGDVDLTRARGHATLARSLLDGFSVDEITEAGG